VHPRRAMISSQRPGRADIREEKRLPIVFEFLRR
jgi:hypothetical protein